jgi:hypothetical protein
MDVTDVLHPLHLSGVQGVLTSQRDVIGVKGVIHLLHPLHPLHLSGVQGVLTSQRDVIGVKDVLTSRTSPKDVLHLKGVPDVMDVLTLFQSVMGVQHLKEM